MGIDGEGEKVKMISMMTSHQSNRCETTAGNYV